MDLGRQGLDRDLPVETGVGLSFTDATPDETTFVKFRKRLREAGIQDRIFEAVVAHIQSQGLLIREGTMVDATIIEQSKGSKRDDGTSTRADKACGAPVCDAQASARVLQGIRIRDGRVLDCSEISLVHRGLIQLSDSVELLDCRNVDRRKN